MGWNDRNSSRGSSWGSQYSRGSDWDRNGRTQRRFVASPRKLEPLYQMCSAGCGGWEWQRNRKTCCRECGAPLNDKIDRSTPAADCGDDGTDDVQQLIAALEKRVPGAAAATAGLRAAATPATKRTGPVQPAELSGAQQKCNKAYKALQDCKKSILQCEAKLDRFYDQVDKEMAVLVKLYATHKEAQDSYNAAAEQAQEVIDRTKDENLKEPADTKQDDAVSELVSEASSKLDERQLLALITAATTVLQKKEQEAQKQQERQQAAQDDWIGFSSECVMEVDPKPATKRAWSIADADGDEAQAAQGIAALGSAPAEAANTGQQQLQQNAETTNAKETAEQRVRSRSPARSGRSGSLSRTGSQHGDNDDGSETDKAKADAEGKPVPRGVEHFAAKAAQLQNRAAEAKRTGKSSPPIAAATASKK